MRTAWASLPNGALIDRILDDVAARTEVWNATADTPKNAALAGARYEARAEAEAAARNYSWDTALRISRSRAWGAAGDAASLVGHGRAWEPCWHAISALIAWDDCAVLLTLDPDAVRLLAASGHHPAVLLLPACIALKTT